MSSQDKVRLAVPAQPEFLGLARVTAAGLAGRLGFTFEQVEDLRLAIDEICFALTGSKGRDGILEMTFLLGPDGLTVNGHGRFAGSTPVQLSELSEVILNALVDEHSVSDGAGGPHFRLVKRHHPGKGGVEGQAPGEGQ